MANKCKPFLLSGGGHLCFEFMKASEHCFTILQ